MTTGSNTLNTIIYNEIKQHDGLISFARYMELALYHSEHGYYHSERFDLGKQGDFTTASEISPLFAQCFARQCHQIIKHIGSSDILELGAGTGRFAGDLLIELSKLDTLPSRYFIYEISHRLREKQQALIQSEYPSLFNRIDWLDKIPAHFKGVMIANEVLDALPIHCFRIDNHAIKERCVSWKNNQFAWLHTNPLSDELKHYVEQLRDTYQLCADYESEINLGLPTFVQTLANAMTQGVILFSDYGYGRQEYYHPERNRGTLTCFYQHRHHDNPLILPGLQDITAHVDFTRVVETAANHACTLAGYTTQAAFLLACDLMNIIEEHEKQLTQAEIFNMHQAVKLLTMPTEMGERVKIMALNKNMELPLRGFNLQDRRREL